jgi:AraC-like DNA-binding protein
LRYGLFFAAAKEPRGEEAMDEKGQESGHLMLISPERVFYAGLLGRPRERRPGAFHVYVALKDGLRLWTADGRQTYDELVAVAPNVRHTIASDYRAAICIVIEPESVRVGAIDEWESRFAGEQRKVFARRVRAAYDQLRNRTDYADLTSSEFDKMCFGEALPRRPLDPRVARSIAQMTRFSGEPTTAASCAAEAGLSASRFLHLFKEETGISFRSFRAWKRARHLLHFANQDLNLAHLAQDIGYPDSTHFSHSIRRFYGLKPRAIFSGSRDLAIYRSDQAPESALR